MIKCVGVVSLFGVVLARNSRKALKMAVVVVAIVFYAFLQGIVIFNF